MGAEFLARPLQNFVFLIIAGRAVCKLQHDSRMQCIQKGILDGTRLSPGVLRWSIFFHRSFFLHRRAQFPILRPLLIGRALPPRASFPG
jgi:hypothetical protein